METNLINLIERYGDEEKARKCVEQLKWPDGINVKTHILTNNGREL